ncbi:uncharacterized protein [Rutidosis leptorrhynchoides]|uniref:uncharacterized protein n=1 Tax=Rutidosis leptorrhynchoides TaxID=125765 RepID=UPI003A99B933
MAKWAVELGEHKINFSLRSTIKGQILADYLAELPADVEASAEHQDTPAPILTPWELYTDGACSAVGAGAGVILTGPDGEEHTYALRFNFAVTNNEAEYEALLAGMRIAHRLNVKVLHAYVDSKLVCSQVNGNFEAHDIAMQQYLSIVHNLADQFEAFQVSHVMRGQNKKADALSKLAALAFDHLGKRILIEELHAKSMVMMPLVAPVEESSSTWMTPIIAFLQDGTLPADSVDAKKIRTKAPMYALEGDVLYRTNYLGPHLRCICPNEVDESVPADDLTDPAPATTFAHLDATTVLSRGLAAKEKLKVTMAMVWNSSGLDSGLSLRFKQKTTNQLGWRVVVHWWREQKQVNMFTMVVGFEMMGHE